MTGTTAQALTGHGGTELPRPRPGAHWRWSRPRRALVAGGTLATVLALGVTAGAGAATASGDTGIGTAGHAPVRAPHPTVAGRITALSEDDITVETQGKASVSVAYTSGTRFETDPGPNGATAAGASALKVGDFIGVEGTKNGTTSVTATTVVIGRPHSPGRRGNGGTPPRNGTLPPGAPNE